MDLVKNLEIALESLDIARRRITELEMEVEMLREIFHQQSPVAHMDQELEVRCNSDLISVDLCNLVLHLKFLYDFMSVRKRCVAGTL